MVLHLFGRRFTTPRPCRAGYDVPDQRGWHGDETHNPMRRADHRSGVFAAEAIKQIPREVSRAWGQAVRGNRGHKITRGHLKQGAVSHNSQSSDPKHSEANSPCALCFHQSSSMVAQQMLLIGTSIQTTRSDYTRRDIGGARNHDHVLSPPGAHYERRAHKLQKIRLLCQRADNSKGNRTAALETRRFNRHRMLREKCCAKLRDASTR